MGQKRIKSKHELQTENRLLKMHGFGITIGSLINTLIVTLGVVLVFKYCKDMVISLSGKNTSADISIFTEIKSDINAAVGIKQSDTSNSKLTTSSCPSSDPFQKYSLYLAAISAVLTSSGLLYGKGQAKLKRTTVARMHGRVKDLEQKIDSMRTSSGLTKTGDTRQEDI